MNIAQRVEMLYNSVGDLVANSQTGIDAKDDAAVIITVVSHIMADVIAAYSVGDVGQQKLTDIIVTTAQQELKDRA